MSTGPQLIKASDIQDGPITLVRQLVCFTTAQRELLAIDKAQTEASVQVTGDAPTEGLARAIAGPGSSADVQAALSTVTREAVQLRSLLDRLQQARVREAEQARMRAEEQRKAEAEREARRKVEAAAAAARRKAEEVMRSLRSLAFASVPAGQFTMGSRSSDVERPIHKVWLDAYEIARYPVTVAQFGAFVAATGYDCDPQALFNGDARRDHPVTWVSWIDANAFCHWLSQSVGQTFCLPTEAQWEKAARGTDARTYPWGNARPDDTRCSHRIITAPGLYGKIDEGGTTPVGFYSPRGDSPYGVADMAGNVLEWCADWFDRGYYAKSPARNPTGPGAGTYRVMRGGRDWLYGSSSGSEGHSLRSAHRDPFSPARRYGRLGFRLVRLP